MESYWDLVDAEEQRAEEEAARAAKVAAEIAELMPLVDELVEVHNVHDSLRKEVREAVERDRGTVESRRKWLQDKLDKYRKLAEDRRLQEERKARNEEHMRAHPDHYRDDRCNNWCRPGRHHRHSRYHVAEDCTALDDAVNCGARPGHAALRHQHLSDERLSAVN